MKKSLLFASALSLVLLAGCTKEQHTDNTPGAATQLSISGSIVMPTTKMQIGEPTDGKASVLWEKGDEITLFAANSQNIVPKSSFDMSTWKSTTYYADATATTTSPSTFTYFSYESGLDGDLTNDTYTLYGVCGELDYYEGFPTPLENGFTLPDFSSQTYGTTSPYFMVASTPLEGESLNLEFINTTAVLMLNLSGTANISKITIKQLDAMTMEGTVALAYSGFPSINLLKLPAAGSSAAEFATFIDTNAATPSSTITVNMGASGIQLTEEGVSLPVGVIPFDLTPDDMLIVTVYGNSETFEEKAIECTLLPGNASVTSNSIAYINLAPFAAEDFGQTPPKDDWKAGDVVLDDDFSWIKTAVDWTGSQTGGDEGTDVGGSGSLEYTDLGGWTSSYSNNGFPYYNMLSYSNGASSIVASQLTQHGYSAVNRYGTYEGFCMWYENNGMISTGDESQSCILSYPLSALNNYKGNVTVSFKACRLTSSEGGDGYGMFKPTFPIAIKGNGTIDGNTSITLGSADYAPFTFYEYTFVIENADLTTQIDFGSFLDGGLYLDDLKITISQPTDANQLTGTEVAKPTAELVYAEPETDHVFDITATDAQDLTFAFKVTGPWKLEYGEAVSTGMPKDPAWMKISTVSWYWGTREDKYGNCTPSAFNITDITDNTTGAERSTTIKVVSQDGNTTYATYTFKQAAQ